MNILDYTDLLMWIAIIALVVLTTRTAMWLNRFFIYRAHRKALDHLRRSAMMSERHYEMQTQMSNVRTSDETAKNVERF